MAEPQNFSRGLPIADTYCLLMDLASDAENRATALDEAMSTVEEELGPSALSDDAGIRSASWVDRLRANARRLRQDAETIRAATSAQEVTR